MRNITVSIKMVEAALKNYDNRGDGVEALFRRNGVPMALLARENARISAENYSGLLQDIMIAMGDEMLGYARVPHRLGTWKIMSHAVITADTLGEALRRYCHFFNLFDWGLSPRLSVEDGEAILTLTPTHPEEPLEAYAYVSTLFYYHRFASWLVNLQIPILGVDVNFPPPVYADEFRPMYLFCPVRFRRPVTRMRFSAAMLDKRLLQDKKTLEDFLRNPNLVMVARQFDHNTWQARVQKLIARDLRDIPTFEAVAEQLHVNPQTLRRRLHREGLSYKEIKNHLRRDTAIYHLSRSNMSVEEVAEITGFSESSNFIRAFRQWTGVTPYTYRKGD